MLCFAGQLLRQLLHSARQPTAPCFTGEPRQMGTNDSYFGTGIPNTSTTEAFDLTQGNAKEHANDADMINCVILENIKQPTIGVGINKHANGGDKNQHSNGGEINRHSNGGEINRRYNGREINRHSNGGEINRHSNGGEINRHSNAGEINRHSNGGEINRHSNGGEINRHFDGVDRDKYDNESDLKQYINLEDISRLANIGCDIKQLGCDIKQHNINIGDANKPANGQGIKQHANGGNVKGQCERNAENNDGSLESVDILGLISRAVHKYEQEKNCSSISTVSILLYFILLV